LLQTPRTLMLINRRRARAVDLMQCQRMPPAAGLAGWLSQATAASVIFWRHTHLWSRDHHSSLIDRWCMFSSRLWPQLITVYTLRRQKQSPNFCVSALALGSTKSSQTSAFQIKYSHIINLT